MNGHAGKILLVDLTKKKVSTIPTKKYESWVGGHGMGSALFFDLVKDKTIDGFHPDNLVTFMTSPLSGTLTPSASSRTEVQGIGVQSYPIGWFTRSNFGGRFAAMLKYAGWDGVAVKGRASTPVWIDIRDHEVKIRDCAEVKIWGEGTVVTQKRIRQYISRDGYGDWIKPYEDALNRTTQRPAIVTIGQAGENQSIQACLIHDAGSAAGQGGFGAVWGSKNLKAISVIGTGDVHISDPKALMKARLDQKKNYEFSMNNLKYPELSTDHQSAPVPMQLWVNGGRAKSEQRPSACTGCFAACKARMKDGLGNEAACIATSFYWDAEDQDTHRKATHLINDYGLNAVEMIYMLEYLKYLNKKNLFGEANVPECPLDFKEIGSLKFVEQYVKMVASGEDGKGNSSEFGEDITHGIVRAAEKWGRREEDLKKKNRLQFPYWGLPIHKSPHAQVYWGYGTLLGDREINEHCFDWLKVEGTIAKTSGSQTRVSAEKAVEIITGKMVPFEDDMKMMDFSDNNIYSKHMAKFTTWHRYYTRFWKQSALFCDLRWPDFINVYAEDKVGSTGEAEPKFFNAVTGKDFTFLDGINLGKKIWNLDNAIWTLQDRHRDMLRFADYIYDKRGSGGPEVANAYMPTLEDGKWDYRGCSRRKLDRKGFEEFKTIFYELNGWDQATGWPLASALKEMGLENVTSELEKAGKLGTEL